MLIGSTTIEKGSKWSTVPIIIKVLKHIQNTGVGFLPWLLEELLRFIGNKWKELMTDHVSDFFLFYHHLLIENKPRFNLYTRYFQLCWCYLCKPINEYE